MCAPYVHLLSKELMIYLKSTENTTGHTNELKQKIHCVVAKNESAAVFVLCERILVKSQSIFYHFIHKNKIIYPFCLCKVVE